MGALKLSEAQRRVLQHYANGDGAAESWTHDFSGGPTALQWQRHERTVASLERHGWIDSEGITEAGKAALAVPPRAARARCNSGRGYQEGEGTYVLRGARIARGPV